MSVIWVIIALIINCLRVIIAEDTYVTLNQGTVIGLKVFPETSRIAVYTFLGIPYSQPPTGKYRFALPRPHGGWNQTLVANKLKPICPQPRNNIYAETTDRLSPNLSQLDNEDCLFLNIWTPETGLRYGNLPVIVIITGEEMSFDWPNNRPSGLDLASEGIVVVTVQYRTNVFGWLSLNNEDLPGNFGLHDQRLALQWMQQNIHKFGGNPKQVSLLGHGTTGAVCALIHQKSIEAKNLFTKVIIMSAGFGITQKFDTTGTLDLSKQIIKKLKCDSHLAKQTVNCIREKSTGDIKQAFKSVYNSSNWSMALGPILTNYVTNERSERFPMMIGICSNEGAFIRDYWIDLARENYTTLWRHINETLIPQLLVKYSYFGPGVSQIIEAINWKFFNPYPKTSSYLLNSIQRIISEAEYEAPFFETLELLSQYEQSETNSFTEASAPMFVYSFQQDNSMDMRGKINLFGGASHSSDLPLIMGPSLFQQIARRRFASSEDKLCRKLKQLITDFIKTGNPTPGRVFDAWQPYTIERKFIKILGKDNMEEKTNSLTQFEQNLPIIETLLEKTSEAPKNFSNRMELNPYVLGGSTDVLRKGKASYFSNRVDYEYANHLKKVHSFWYLLLKSIKSHSILLDEARTERNGREVQFLSNDSKYKHAFFSMLTLVCLLLGVLGVCAYILRKNNRDLSSSL